ncbi:MAG: SH3 domain-containing protein [Chloroflexota bacterium]|nr:SH3 domain-containing protein [Chloroflexota bacterium]
MHAVKYAYLAAATAAMLALASCGGGQAAGSAASSGSASLPASSSQSAFPTPSAPPPVAAKPPPPPDKFTNQNWGRAVFEATRSDLSQFKGIPVELTGQVFNVEQDASRVGVQMWVYPERADGNTVVVFAKAGAPAVNKGDTIKVIGTVNGELVRKNDQGQTLHLPRVAATSVSVQGKAASAAAAPSSAVASATVAGPALYSVSGAPASGVNVRAAPSLTAARKGLLHNGDVVRVTAQPAKGWDEVQGTGFSGFVSSAYLTASKATNPQLAKLSPVR